MIDPFGLKFFSLIQNNIGLNIGDWLNFVTCEQTLTMNIYFSKKSLIKSTTFLNCRTYSNLFCGTFITSKDLGCGWGSLTLWLLENYPRIHVVSVSNSNTQRRHIEAKVIQMGYSTRSECITADANFFNTDRKFDRIISIEMFEVSLCGCGALVKITHSSIEYK